MPFEDGPHRVLRRFVQQFDDFLRSRVLVSVLLGSGRRSPVARVFSWVDMDVLFPNGDDC